jgi:hypothetical protein
MSRSQTYASLSHRFVLTSNDEPLARRAGDLIGEFARPVSDGVARISYELLALAGVGGDSPRYALKRGDEEIAANSDASAVIDHLLWRITDDTVELADGFLLVHAGAVVSADGGGVLILGEAGSGKTTLVAALVQEGFGYLSDEAGAIELDTGVAHPWPRALGFTAGSRSLARFAPLFVDDDIGTGKTHVVVERIRPAAIGPVTRIQHVIDHRFSAGAQTRVEPLSRATAVARMGSAAPRLRREGGRGLNTLVEVMRGAEAHRIVSGDLDAAVSAVCGLAAR